MDLQPYLQTITVFGVVGALMLVQLVIADVVGIKRRHRPGYPVEPNHADFLFRTNRALANSNESVAIFVLAALFSIGSTADPGWTNAGALIYLFGRVGHMLFYYLSQQIPRSLSFAVSLIGVVIILAAGFRQFF